MALSLLSVVHVNVNCSELERSLAFYRDVVGLTPVSHTNPLPQKGDGFGLEGEVQWDAHLLHDDRGVGGPAVDLLEWKRPAPTGRPPPEANHLGFFRLCLSHPDLEALHRKLRGAGVPCRSAPVAVPVLAGQPPVRFLCCADPDGTCVEFIERPGPTRLLHVNVNCRDLDVSSAWYQRVLGLTPITDRAEPPPAGGEGFGLRGECAYRADFLVVPQAEPFVVDLLEWKTPRPVGRPLTEANHLGMFRMAFLVADAHASCAELDRLGVAHSGPCWLEMGPEIPVDGLFAVFFRDPDGTCLELIQTPELKGP